jgi:c-opsin
MDNLGIGSITTLSVLAILRCKIVVQNHVYSANRFSAFTTRSVRLGCHKATLLLTLIWSYVLLVTCPPMFGWGQYDREPSQIRSFTLSVVYIQRLLYNIYG